MSGIDIFIYTAYALFFVAAGAAVLMPLYNAIGQPKTLMTGAIGIVGLLIIFLVGWGLSGSEVTGVYTKFGVASSGSKAIGGALTTMYLLIFLAVVGIIYSEIRTIFNR